MIRFLVALASAPITVGASGPQYAAHEPLQIIANKARLLP